MFFGVYAVWSGVTIFIANAGLGAASSAQKNRQPAENGYCLPCLSTRFGTENVTFSAAILAQARPTSTQRFRVKLSRKRRRTNDICKQDGKLAALPVTCLRRRAAHLGFGLHRNW